MALSDTDRRWLRRMVRDEVRRGIEDLLESAAARMGSYDGAHEAERDAGAEEGRQPVGFRVGGNYIRRATNSQGGSGDVID